MDEVGPGVADGRVGEAAFGFGENMMAEQATLTHWARKPDDRARQCRSARTAAGVVGLIGQLGLGHRATRLLRLLLRRATKMARGRLACRHHHQPVGRVVRAVRNDALSHPRSAATAAWIMTTSWKRWRTAGRIPPRKENLARSWPRRSSRYHGLVLLSQERISLCDFRNCRPCGNRKMY